MTARQGEFDFSAFDRKAGQAEARAGAQEASDHAEAKTDQEWSAKAFKFLNEYIKTVGRFMAEDLRRASTDQVPEPPSLRAWGHIVGKAARVGLITRIGYEKVKNRKAHATPAAVWQRTRI